MKKQNERLLRDLLGQYARNPKVKPQLFRKKIEQFWPEMMGSWVASETRSIKVEHQKLILSIHSDALRHELHFSQQQILERVNDYLGEEYIKEVIVR